MYCSYCDCATHNIFKCNADISLFFDAFAEIYKSNPYGLRAQYILLNRFSTPVVTRISRRCGLDPVESKQDTIGNLLKKCFAQHCFADFQPTIEIVLQLRSAYRELNKWEPITPELISLKKEMMDMLDDYYKTRFFPQPENPTIPEEA